jgi:hypothetical protein
MPALRRHGRAILNINFITRAALLLAAISHASAAKAQSAFDPEPVSYVLCVTNAMKRLALETPPIATDAIVERTFRACGEDETQLRKSLAGKGVAANVIEDRLALIKKFIRQTLPDDIERFRANVRPR